MKVTFLGTGTSQGVPVIGCECEVCKSLDYRDKRLRSSISIECNGLSLIVDTGPDFRQQTLRERIKRIDAVLFTHAHKDHTAGLDDIRSFNFLQKEEIPIFGQPNTLAQLKAEFSYIFADKKYPGVPQVLLNEIQNRSFTVKGLDILPIEVIHYKLPVFGYRIANFTYITDANYISDEEKKKIKGSKVLVINALQKTDHISHFTLSQALDLINEINPQKAYLTHLSHKMGLHKEVEAELPDNVRIAYDGLTIEIE